MQSIAILPVRSFVSAACALLALALPGSTQAQPDLVDRLTGPASPRLEIPFPSYGYTREGLLRVSDDCSGKDRLMVQALPGDWAHSDFVFELDVFRDRTQPDEYDVTYVGFGQGTVGDGAFNEPANAFQFRVHHRAGFYRIDTGVTGASARRPWLAVDTGVGQFGNAVKVRLRIERRGDTITLSIPRQGVSRSYSFAVLAATLGPDAGSARFFFGSSVAGTVFSNFRLTRGSSIRGTSFAASQSGQSVARWP